MVVTNEEGLKEVKFDVYCKKCKYKNKAEKDEPCEECLENPTNTHTHRPVNYKEK